MRLSKYNYYWQQDKILFVYNTLYNKIIKIIDDNLIDAVLNKNLEIISKTNLNKLFESGILTTYTLEEEKLLCDNKYYSKVYNDTLDLTLITTRACNFRCGYCAQEHENTIMSSKIYNSIVKYIIKNIYSFTQLKIVLFGGEPTLATHYFLPFLEEIQKICSFYKKRFSGVMITNGYLLDKELIRKLYKYNITQYQITLDGDQQNHDSCRTAADGSGTFNIIYNNLTEMLKATELKRLSVAIRINGTRELFDKVDSWKDLYLPFSSDRRFLINLGVVEDRGGSYIESFDKELINESDVCYKNAKKLLSEHRFYEDFICTNYFVCKDISKRSFTIDVDGSVRTCSKLYTDNIIGVLDERGNIIWNNKHSFFSIKTNKNCSNCEFEPLCQGKSCGLKNICNKNTIESFVIEYIKKQDNLDCY